MSSCRRLVDITYIVGSCYVKLRAWTWGKMVHCTDIVSKVCVCDVLGYSNIAFYRPVSTVSTVSSLSDALVSL